ncbi:MAG: hypothetical protein GVY19_01615 [Bacteroidetes bacterium]|nr:hypothetical protein [Bacteroidota bacterium]
MRLLISFCRKSPVLDKKAPFSRLAKLGNPQFTDVNEEFPDKRNAEPTTQEELGEAKMELS